MKNIIKKMLSIGLAAAMCLMVTGCNVDISQIGVTEELTIPKGESAQVEINYGTDIPDADAAKIAEAAEKVALTWTSSDESIATVDETGLVTAVAPGEVDVTVTIQNSNLTDTCHITVVVLPEGITAKENMELAVGSTENVDAVMTPEDATGVAVFYESDNEEIATVDEDGLVTAVSEGECVITSYLASDAVSTDESAVDPEMLVVADSEKAMTTVTVTAGENATPEPTEATTEEPAEATTPAAPVNFVLKGKNSVYAGSGIQLSPVTTSGTDLDVYSLTWTSSDPSVAIVTNGWIDAKKAGTVTITATNSGGSTATAQVQVMAVQKVTTNKSGNSNASVANNGSSNKAPAAPAAPVAPAAPAPVYVEPAPAPVEQAPVYVEPAPAPVEQQPVYEAPAENNQLLISAEEWNSNSGDIPLDAIREGPGGFGPGDDAGDMD